MRAALYTVAMICAVAGVVAGALGFIAWGTIAVGACLVAGSFADGHRPTGQGSTVLVLLLALLGFVAALLDEGMWHAGLAMFLLWYTAVLLAITAPEKVSAA